MNFSDIEPNGPLLDPLPKKPGPGDCQCIDLGPVDPRKTIEMSRDELELRELRWKGLLKNKIISHVNDVSEHIPKDPELSKNPGWKTIAIEVTTALVEKVSEQIGVKEIGEAMVTLYARETAQLFTKTHLIDLALGKLTPALLKNFLDVGGDALAELSKELAAALIKEIRSKKSSEK